METCILIDGSGLIYRGFYGIPPFFKSPKGVLTNAVFGFTSILLNLLTTHKPTYMAVAFDKKGPTFRHKEFTEYKATRIKAPQELYDQIPLVKEVVTAFGIPQFEVTGFEADDILAAIVKKLGPRKNIEVLIATGDFDMFQIAGPRVAILYPTKGFKGAEKLSVADIEKKYELTPAQIPDYKGIAGDHSDNLPGVKGIGEKGAKSLLKKYETLEGVYAHLDEMSESVRKKLVASKEAAFMSRQLATLSDRVPLDFDLAACKAVSFNAPALRAVFADLGFNSLQRRLDELYGKEVKAEAEPKTTQEALF